MNQRVRWSDAVALVAAIVATWSAIAQRSVTAWNLAIVVAALLLYAYPRFRGATGGGKAAPNIAVAPSDSTDAAMGMVFAGLAMLVVVAFFFLIYVGLAECVPFGLGGAQSC